MTFDQWFSMFVDETIRIMDVQSNILMGSITVATMLLLVIFNNYGWRRAFVMTAFTTSGVGGWYWVGVKVLGGEVHSGPAFTIVVYTILLCAYTIFGYLMAGVIVMLKPHPVVKMRLALIWSLRKLADLLDNLRKRSGDLLMAFGSSLQTEGVASRSLRHVASSIPAESYKDATKHIQKELRSTLLDIANIEEV